jgi:hypothetical protein
MARDDFRRGMLYGFAAAGLTPQEAGDLVIQMNKQADLSGIASNVGNVVASGAVRCYL